MSIETIRYEVQFQANDAGASEWFRVYSNPTDGFIYKSDAFALLGRYSDAVRTKYRVVEVKTTTSKTTTVVEPPPEQLTVIGEVTIDNKKSISGNYTQVTFKVPGTPIERVWYLNDSEIDALRGVKK